MLLDLTESQAQTLRTTVDYLLTKDFDETLTLSGELLKDEKTTNHNLRSIREQLEPKATDEQCLTLSVKELTLLHLILYKEFKQNPYHNQDLAELIAQQDPDGVMQERLRWLTNPKRK